MVRQHGYKKTLKKIWWAMSNSQKSILLIVAFSFIVFFGLGCASNRSSHRNNEGVLKTQTRAEGGIHKADNP